MLWTACGPSIRVSSLENPCGNQFSSGFEASMVMPDRIRPIRFSEIGQKRNVRVVSSVRRSQVGT